MVAAAVEDRPARRCCQQVAQEVKQKGVTQDLLNRLAQGSLLARLFAVGLKNVRSSREVMKESLEEGGRVVAHELERFLTTLGTIASLSPIMGLFGTVVGMIEIFGAQGGPGMTSNPAQLAHGISVALYNTAMGLLVAIPSMIFYRHYRAKVDAPGGGDGDAGREAGRDRARRAQLVQASR